jgi:Fe-S cluster assembly ATP-binding protein
MLEIKNLHARIAEDGTEIIRGLNLTVKAGEVAAIMGAERLGQVDAVLHSRGPRRLRGHRG